DAEKRGSQLFAERFELQRIALDTWSIAAPTVDRPPAKSISGWGTLSKAEQEVAVLAAAGWPNSAIGARRGTSTKTIDGQIASIFQKLMINSRTDIIRLVPHEQRNRISAERSHRPRRTRGRPRSVQSRTQG